MYHFVAPAIPARVSLEKARVTSALGVVRRGESEGEGEGGGMRGRELRGTKLSTNQRYLKNNFPT